MQRDGELRIALYSSIISLGKRGHFIYTKNLIKYLLSIDKENQYVLFYNYFKKPSNEFNFSISQTNVKNRYYHLPTKILEFFWRRLYFPPIDLMIGRVDIFHSIAFHLSYPDFYLPPQICGKLIVTIHDIIPLSFPQYYSESYLEACRRGLALASRKASLIITDSYCSKNAIKEMANINDEKVRVIPLAVDELFRPITDREKILAILEKYGLGNKYILFVGGTNTTKNLDRLMEAFSLIRENLQNEYKLVLVGRKENEYERISQQAKELKLENAIILTEHISEEELPYIYNGAELFVFPSLCEGFGLPPLEAMACGVPVITSNVSSLPEVVGDAAVLVDPYNVEEIAETIKEVLQDHALRDILSKKGLERAKNFSWEKTAQQTLEVYREVGEQ